MASRVAIVFEGTRGDSQPYIVAGKALQDAGYQVMLAGAADSEPMAKSFGLAFTSYLPPAQMIWRDPKMVEVCTHNNILKIFVLLNRFKTKSQETLGKLYQGIVDFEPDLILSSMLALNTMIAFSNALQIPVIGLFLQPLARSNYVPVLGILPMLPAWMDINKRAWTLAFKFMSRVMMKNNAGVLEKIIGRPQADFWLPSELFYYMDCEPEFPLLFAVSNAFHDSMPMDFSQKCVAVGSLMFNASEQKGPDFGADEFAMMQVFLAAGEAPVYIGYGSITCHTAKFMTLLSLRALRLTKQRGVLLGGWAGMSLEHVEGEPDADELKAYCSENVLFMKTAPHAFLFPRCKVIVHHGGAGTLNASARSGVPTIIAPICFDQFGHSKLVNADGFGVGLGSMKNLKPHQLAAAIEKCISSEPLRSRARDVGTVLAEENGPAKLVEEVDRYMRESVATGIHTQRVRQLRASILSDRRGLATSGWLQAIRRLVCCRRRKVVIAGNAQPVLPVLLGSTLPAKMRKVI